MPGREILIVDDEPDIAEVLGDRLEAAGYGIRIAGSARECYAAIEKKEPDLILLDIQMPEISGMEALVEIKSSHPGIPVLMVSASTTRQAARASQERGADGFLLKPYEPEELMEKVSSLLASKSGNGSAGRDGRR